MLPEKFDKNQNVKFFFFNTLLISNKDNQMVTFKKKVNLFFPNSPFLYPQKTSEDRKVFWCL